MALDLCKYYKKQEYVSFNDGITWQPLESYERGELYESHSSSCGAGIFQYKWMQINNGYICDGKDRYSREIYQYSEDGVVWYNVWPTVYRKGFLIEENSPFCDNAGNGQYESGGTEPSSGDTLCPKNYVWNGVMCVCLGAIDSHDRCIVCRENEHFDYTLDKCVCDDGFNYKPCNICAKDPDDCHRRGGVDPLKIVKCSNSDGILTFSDINYFENDWRLLSYEIGDCIYRIDDAAFNGQIRLSSITISSSVEEVGEAAFGNCFSLTNITFPSSLTVLEKRAFLNCSKLESIIFGGSIPSIIEEDTFYNCASLQNISIPSGVTSIGNRVFYNCFALQDFPSTQTLTSIGNSSFKNCTSLEFVEIPSGVTSIGDNAFEGCTSLIGLQIHSNTVNIGNSAFTNCSSLTSVTIDSSGVTMSSNVFNGCTRLLKMTFTSPTPFAITQGEFDNTNNCAIFVPCGSLQAYKTAWSQYADRISCNDTGVYYRWVDDSGAYCDGYDEYTRQKQQQTTNGITWTDNGVYRPITFITHYSRACGYEGDVALTVTNADGRTRYYEPCPIPMKFQATYSGGTTYSAICDSSSTIVTADTRPTGYEYTAMTSAVISDECVTSIGTNAFRDCRSLSSVTIPNTVTSIGEGCFYYCNKLRSIEIPNSVTSIGSNAFYLCEALSSCTIPYGVTRISVGLFSYCSNLQSVTMPNGITTIGEMAFMRCALTSVTIPNTVEIIDTSAFYRCQALSSLTIPDSVTTISTLAFYNCSSLSTVTIGSGITSIGNYAFQNCVSLDGITINATTPPTLQGSNVFLNSNNCPIYVPCESVDAYKSANRWSDYASRIQCIQPFEGKFKATYSDSTTYSADCDSSTSLTTATTRAHSTSYTAMTTAEIGNCVTSIGDMAFDSCKSLTSVVIPDSVTSIGDSAFVHCSSLTSVTIGSGVTSIGAMAFESCESLTSVVIPDSVSTIGGEAFAICSSLTSVTSLATTPPTLKKLGGSYNTFYNTNNCPIYVPSESVEAYKAAGGWSFYASRIQAIT